MEPDDSSVLNDFVQALQWSKVFQLEILHVIDAFRNCCIEHFVGERNAYEIESKTLHLV